MAGFYRLLEIAPEDIKGAPKQLADLLDKIAEDEKRNPVSLHGWIIYSKLHLGFNEWYDKDLRNGFSEYTGKQCRIYSLIAGKKENSNNLSISNNADCFIDQEYTLALARRLEVKLDLLPSLIIYEKFQDLNPDGILALSFSKISSREQLAKVFEKLGALLYDCSKDIKTGFDRKLFLKKLQKIEREINIKFLLQKAETFQPVILYFADLLREWLIKNMGA